MEFYSDIFLHFLWTPTIYGMTYTSKVKRNRDEAENVATSDSISPLQQPSAFLPSLHSFLSSVVFFPLLPGNSSTFLTFAASGKLSFCCVSPDFHCSSLQSISPPLQALFQLLLLQIICKHHNPHNPPCLISPVNFSMIIGNKQGLRAHP